MRVLKLRLLFPTARIDSGVRIGAGVRVRVTDGGSLHIGAGTKIAPYCFLVAKRGALIIGPNSFVGQGSVLCANERVEIERDALIAEYVTIRDQDHDLAGDPGVPLSQRGMRVAPIQIGANAWVASKSTILAGVTIGRDSVVAAHALVKRGSQFEPKSLIAGVPAKRVRSLH